MAFYFRRAWGQAQGTTSLLLAAPRAPSNVVLTRCYAKGKNSSKKSSSYEPAASNAPLTTVSSKGGKVVEVIPGSKNQFGSEFRDEWEKVKTKMSASTEWFRREAGVLETQGSGRVLPSLLESVRVTVSNGSNPVRLQEVATVGVKDGTTFVVTVFEEQNLKSVEQALFHSRIPHLFPQKVDSRTIRIPVARPTMETRAALLVSVSKLAEDCKVQIRKHHQAVMKELKPLGYTNKSKAGEEIQALTDKFVGDIDGISQRLKNELGS